jgi:hypothetical protein
VSGAPGVRVAGLATAATGSTLLLAARPVLAGVAGRPGSSGELAVARVLGIRQVAEGLLLAAGGRRQAAKIAAVVEWTHMTSMVAVAALSTSHRRSAAASGLVAGVVGGACLVAARSGS